ncbi:MAG TPA: glutamine-hydrolyzing carbamoyl-phosphate synthase small subunit [Candidatus Fimivivens faecavium]|nr:glutamine-hydrolyzing carbamoyl-phosphate synthase small subunit [Candidatus Fimivivens faecavium]
MVETAYLILENGRVFEGKRFGAGGEAAGEIVFTTAMTGYLETLTDPSYYGQIVVQTFPLIGNYGVIPADFESGAVHPSAYIVREWCDAPSNFRSEGDLNSFLEKEGVIGLWDIDTRALTRIVREYGVMNARISSTPELTAEEEEALEQYRVRGGVGAVTRPNELAAPSKEHRYRVGLWDFGAKANIVRELVKHGCDVTLLPASTKCERIQKLGFDGVMLSNGPGDPQDNAPVIEELRKFLTLKTPTMGICLGHQLAALAMGCETEKMKYGHRGENQPVLEVKTGRIYITSQNHGYCVKTESLPENAAVSYTNGNDGTCEGIDYTDRPLFTVQFHPEAAGGPEDTRFLFDRFLRMMDQYKAK